MTILIGEKGKIVLVGDTGKCEMENGTTHLFPISDLAYWLKRADIYTANNGHIQLASWGNKKKEG